MRHATLLKRLAAATAALLLSIAWLMPVRAQQSLQNLSDPAFPEHKAIAVPFKHNEHNAKAKLAKCETCHHDFATGTRVATGKSSTERRCSYCHMAQPAPDDHVPALMTAYHKLCQDCHRAQGKGPLKCGECHTK